MLTNATSRVLVIGAALSVALTARGAAAANTIVQAPSTA